MIFPAGTNDRCLHAVVIIFYSYWWSAANAHTLRSFQQVSVPTPFNPLISSRWCYWKISVHWLQW